LTILCAIDRPIPNPLCSLLLCSCNREVDFYFNFGSQSLCVYKSSFYNLSIENDSITPDGKSYEGAISLFWTDSANSPPRRIYLDRIPKGYSVYRGGIKSSEKRISLKGNSVYTITSTGIAAVGCSIKVWTNHRGEVIKAIQMPQLGNANGDSQRNYE